MEHLNKEQLIHLNPMAEIDRLRVTNAKLLAALEEAASALDAAKRWLDDAKFFNAANSIAANAEQARAVIEEARKE